MENLKYEMKGDSLIVTILNVKAAGKPSSTGKTKLVATTSGFVTVDANTGLKLMVNVTVPNT